MFSPLFKLPSSRMLKISLHKTKLRRVVLTLKAHAPEIPANATAHI